MYLCLCPGGDVHQPRGGKGEDPWGAETLAGGRLGPNHPTETGGEKKLYLFQLRWLVEVRKLAPQQRKCQHIKNSYPFLSLAVISSAC